MAATSCPTATCRQFGLHPAKASENQTVQNFRIKVLRELKKIKIAWPELNYATAKGVLILHPSTPAIAPLNQGQLLGAGFVGESAFRSSAGDRAQGGRSLP